MLAADLVRAHNTPSRAPWLYRYDMIDGLRSATTRTRGEFLLAQARHTLIRDHALRAVSVNAVSESLPCDCILDCYCSLPDGGSTLSALGPQASTHIGRTFPVCS